MGKTLGDYNIEKSSFSDINNIQWTQKNSVTDKSKITKKKKAKTSPTNVIPHKKTKKIKLLNGRIFKIKKIRDTKKLQNNIKDKRFQNSSASICKIEQGFIRPAR
ncbi:MAG: hypothetical protein OEL77_01140 [Nitrosopumilus sp.]|nr:hypothetical protein [Nitrosopumilus sp.]MDH3384602.1 hypothetical protein [Nitrosopumilus sp.]